MKHRLFKRQYLMIFACIIFLCQCVYRYNNLSLLLLGWSMFKLYQYHTLNVKWLCVIFVCLGIRLWWSHVQLQSQKLADIQQYSEVWIETYPLDLKEKNDVLLGTVKIYLPNHQKIHSRIRISREHLGNHWQALQDTSYLIKASVNSEPIKEARNFNVFDYKDFASLQYLFWQTEIDNISQLRPSASFWAMYQNIRAQLFKPLRKLDHHPWISLQNIVLFNIQSEPYQRMKESFSKWGILHFFAISGFHIGVIIQCLDHLLRKVGCVTENISKVISVILVLYGCLIGWPIGSIRAIASYYITNILKKLQIHFSALDQVAIIGIIMLYVNPTWACHLGFLLSFFMTLIIKFFQSHHQNCSMEMTALCMMLSWPLTLNMSQQWHPATFIVLIIFSYGFEKFFLPMMVMTCLLSVIFPSGLTFLLSQLSDLGETIHDFSFPLFGVNASFTNLHISDLTMWVMVSFLLFTLWCYHAKSKWIFWLNFLLWHIFILNIPYYWRFEDRITMIDVGQGDAMLIQPAMSSSNWLIDTGGKLSWSSDFKSLNQVDKEFAHRTIVSALRGLNVDYLDGIIITHADIDHMGNLSEVLQNFQVDKIIINTSTQKSKEWAEIIPILNSDIRIMCLQPGDSMALSQHMNVYQVNENPSQYDPNLSSIITHVKLGQLSLLNVGDAPVEIEDVLIKKLKETNIDILKVGHHGSYTSTSDNLLKVLKPKAAWISVGEKNHYGHPHSQVIDRLSLYKIPVWLTSKHGAVQVRQDVWGQITIDTMIE